MLGKGFKNYDAKARLAEFFLLSEEPGDVPGQLFGIGLWQGPTGESGDVLRKNTPKLRGLWFHAGFWQSLLHGLHDLRARQPFLLTKFLGPNVFSKCPGENHLPFLSFVLSPWF